MPIKVIIVDSSELEGVSSRFPVPDFSAEYRSAHDWGYVEIAGIVRYMKWEDHGCKINTI